MSGRQEERQGLVTEVGYRIFELRKGRSWSQGDLAGRLGLPRWRVARWETGQQAPHMDELVAVGQLFRISLDELVTGCRPSA